MSQCLTSIASALCSSQPPTPLHLQNLCLHWGQEDTTAWNIIAQGRLCLLSFLNAPLQAVCNAAGRAPTSPE